MAPQVKATLSRLNIRFIIYPLFGYPGNPPAGSSHSAKAVPRRPFHPTSSSSALRTREPVGPDRGNAKKAGRYAPEINTVVTRCLPGRRTPPTCLQVVLVARQVPPRTIRRACHKLSGLRRAVPRKIFLFSDRTWRKHDWMPAPETLLQLTEVTKRYATGGRQDVPVLGGISLEVHRGETLAIVGPSGSGKSTLLQIIGTLDRPTSGAVLLDGNNLAALDDRQLARVRNQQIGFVFQAHYLLPQCTVLENVLVPTLANPSPGFATLSPSDGERDGVRGAPTESSAQRAERLLKRVGLGERLYHRPGQLSGGERQRVAVVRALINRPQLLLADEPTGALDHASATALGQLLVELNQEEGVTLIVVTHALDLARRMGRVMSLSDGRLAEIK